jgi:hypothetical protein
VYRENAYAYLTDVLAVWLREAGTVVVRECKVLG